MLSLKENFFATIRGEKADAFVNSWEVLPLVWDPISAFITPAAPGKTTVSPLGITFHWRADEPGLMPVTTPDKLVVKDVADWKEYVKIPDLMAIDFDWTEAKAKAEAIREEGKLVLAWCPTGLFEMSHFLCGFEGALCGFYEEPEAMHEMIEAIKDMKLKQIELLWENLKPDVMNVHDDLGSKTSLFLSPDMWREFFKEPYREIYKSIKDKGMIAMHHSDSYAQPLVKDMVELGIDIWQGVIPTNDFAQIKKDTDYKLTLMGGIDGGKVDVPGWTQELIRDEVSRACREYSQCGCFIPCLTYGDEGSIFPGVNDAIMEEIRKQNAIYFG